MRSGGQLLIALSRPGCACQRLGPRDLGSPDGSSPQCMVRLLRRGKRRQVCLVVWKALAEFFEQLQVEDSGQLVEQCLERGDRLSEYQGAERMHRRRKLEIIK